MHNQAVSNRGTPSEVDVSPREAEVLAALAEHLTNAEIGVRLFISVRTVESHVSSLLRKLQVEDRRALAAVGARLGTARASTPGTPIAVPASLPSPLTSFVGRRAERAALTDALAGNRLVTAVGPGGVGKTRLALSVVAEVADRFADGAWFVGLVSVTDPSMIASALAAALGLGEHQSRSAEETVVGWLADRETLLVLDNCEHLLDGVIVLLERLLAGCPRLVVLATSRARLLVPFEWVFPVPGLSLAADGSGPGDAAELFLVRAAAGGHPPAANDWARVVEVCRGLDGMALAIELAAARVPSLGLDGVEAGLADRLRLLSGGARVDDRHRSLRATLDWSYALLDDAAQAVLRRVSVFAAPLSAAAAADIAGWSPVTDSAVPTILAGLADQSLLVAVPDAGGTRYRVAETIRQYGADQCAETGESAEVQLRHLHWCLGVAAALEPVADDGAWRTAFDLVADEFRSALRGAAAEDRHRPAAYRLAIRLAELCFARGMPAESQARYEQAADLAGDDDVAAALRGAAGAAESRYFGTDALRLRRAAADAALRVGDRAAAAVDLARAAELINRAAGLMAVPPPVGAADALLDQARALAVGDPAAEARVLTAEAFNGPDNDPVTAELTERAITLARRVGDPLAESAALDQFTSIQLARGEVRAAAASAVRRIELLAPLPVTAASALEFFDAFGMSTDCAIAAGDLPGARRLAEGLRDLPFHREEAHLATGRLIVLAALAGAFTEAVSLSERYREGWEQAGRPRAGNLGRGAYAAATVHGLRGNDKARADWLEIVAAVASPIRPLSEIHYNEFFDALLLLHQGHPDRALQTMDTPPEQFRTWYSGQWRPWYAALWAESAALTGHEDAADRIHRARLMTADNPIAAALVSRSAALNTPGGNQAAMTAAAAALRAAGCRYQWARTLVLTGGADRVRGEAALAAMGTTPMAVPLG